MPSSRILGRRDRRTVVGPCPEFRAIDRSLRCLGIGQAMIRGRSDKRVIADATWSSRRPTSHSKRPVGRGGHDLRERDRVAVAGQHRRRQGRRSGPCRPSAWRYVVGDLRGERRGRDSSGRRRQPRRWRGAGTPGPDRGAGGRRSQSQDRRIEGRTRLGRRLACLVGRRCRSVTARI